MGPGATEQQKEVIAAVLENPVLAGVVAKMLKEVGNDPTALAQYSKSNLANALDTLPATPAVGEIKTIDNHQAVVGQITVNGQQLDTLLSEGSFNKSRSDQYKYAAKLDCRMATRAENRAYVEDLLAKEDNNTINEAEKNALKTYRDRLVRDTESGLGVDGRRVRDYSLWYVYDNPDTGALFVRASAESK